MIKLTRFNGAEFILNADLIKFIEKTPDTVVTLRDGEKVLVKEAPEEVVRRSIEYRRALYFVPEPPPKPLVNQS